MSRVTRTASGADETRMSSSAGAAAWAKKASEDADHMAVANVLKPSGLKMRVAGSSFIVMRKTSAAPDMTPGRTRGTVTAIMVWRGDLPRPRAISSSRGLTCSRDALVAPSAAGKNSTMYASNKSQTV